MLYSSANIKPCASDPRAASRQHAYKDRNSAPKLDPQPILASRPVEDLTTDGISQKDASRGEQAAHPNPRADHVGFCAKGSQDGRLQGCCTAREEAVDESECNDPADASTRDPCER